MLRTSAVSKVKEYQPSELSQVIVVPMDNLSRSERIFNNAKSLVVAGIISGIYFLLPIPRLGTFVLVLGSVIIVLFLLAWARKIKYSELDFQRNEIRQFRANPFFPKRTQRSLKEFEVVTSSINMGRSGPYWISVSLSGRNGQLEVARFGANGITSVGKDRYDHPEAWKLRDRLSELLNIKDIGTV